MGGAHCKLENDTHETCTVYTFDYSDGLRTIPRGVYTLGPGDLRELRAAGDSRGLIVATQKGKNGHHRAVANGKLIFMSTLPQCGGKQWYDVCDDALKVGAALVGLGIIGVVIALKGAATGVPAGATGVTAVGATGVAAAEATGTTVAGAAGITAAGATGDTAAGAAGVTAAGATGLVGTGAVIGVSDGVCTASAVGESLSKVLGSTGHFAGFSRPGIRSAITHTKYHTFEEQDVTVAEAAAKNGTWTPKETATPSGGQVYMWEGIGENGIEYGGYGYKSPDGRVTIFDAWQKGQQGLKAKL